MKKSICHYLFFLIAAVSCTNQTKQDEAPPSVLSSWEQRTAAVNHLVMSIRDTVYIPVYSDIYIYTEHRTVPLTATVSIRNTSLSDSLFLHKVDYYNTKGDLIKKYIDKSIFVKPMETIEVIIAERDNLGGTGANFIIDWSARNPRLNPLFQAVMLTTASQQGLSFVTQGVSVHQ